MTREPFEAVRAVLTRYFDGLYAGDTVVLAEVFHPAARYVCAVDGLIDIGMDAYFPIVDRRPSPASRNEARRDHIDTIAFAGPVTAFARVRCSIGSKDFTDFLTLIQVDGQWRIIAKVFHFDLNTALDEAESSTHGQGRDPCLT